MPKPATTIQGVFFVTKKSNGIDVPLVGPFNSVADLSACIARNRIYFKLIEILPKDEVSSVQILNYAQQNLNTKPLYNYLVDKSDQ